MTSSIHLTQLLLIDYAITVGRLDINTEFLHFLKEMYSKWCSLCNDAKVLWLIVRVLLRYAKMQFTKLEWHVCIDVFKKNMGLLWQMLNG